MAEEGGAPHTIRRSPGTRGGVCGVQLSEIRGARDIPEPPRLQEVLGPSGGRVRLHQHWTISNPLRRVRLRRNPPVLAGSEPNNSARSMNLEDFQRYCHLDFWPESRPLLYGLVDKPIW
ncbi:SAUR-like auxin-responsive protein family [Actinidia rufa]|uniref:SAUR-like auxin-responsive protein family n=1 Tax=Actinidia rufa TaxID=165716 RepID=A0A7J0FAH4_9ERIC|nr:SAUR-like auxin-responsive protein family [Actinidia rufa]